MSASIGFIRGLGAFLAVALAGGMAAGCGPDSGTDAPGGGSGFRAKVDGAAWEADGVGTFANALGISPGNLIVGGTSTRGGVTTSLTLTVYNIADTGTYALGTNLGVDGGFGQVGQSDGGDGKGNAWITPGTGMDGEIRITRLDGGRIVADFRYTAVPGKNNTMTGNREVTEGHLDLPYQGTLLPVQEQHGGKLTATLGGKPYNAATIIASLVDINGNAGVRLTTTTSENGISLSLSGITGPGTYAIVHRQPNPRAIYVGRNGGTAETCCWGQEGDSAEVTITSLTAKRVKGTFKGVLVPQTGKPAPGNLAVTDGAFDVGIAP